MFKKIYQIDENLEPQPNHYVLMIHFESIL